MAGGRPTDYTPELVAKAWEYANGGWVECGHMVPSVAGLALHLGISRETCYAWEKDEAKEFSDILCRIALNQECDLINGGLSGKFNSPITKMMLTKHGYSDRIEQDNTSSDGSMSLAKIERIIVKADNAEKPTDQNG